MKKNEARRCEICKKILSEHVVLHESKYGFVENKGHIFHKYGGYKGLLPLCAIGVHSKNQKKQKVAFAVHRDEIDASAPVTDRWF